MDIINERPEGVDFVEYRQKLKEQKIQIKQYKQGKLFYIASEKIYFPEDTKKLFGFIKSYSPFIGDTKNLIEPIL